MEALERIGNHVNGKRVEKRTEICFKRSEAHTTIEPGGGLTQQNVLSTDAIAAQTLRTDIKSI